MDKGFSVENKVQDGGTNQSNVREADSLRTFFLIEKGKAYWDCEEVYLKYYGGMGLLLGALLGPFIFSRKIPSTIGGAFVGGLIGGSFGLVIGHWEGHSRCSKLAESI